MSRGVPPVLKICTQLLQADTGCLGVDAVATTIYIPLLDPQPITADLEGVDSSGHTTWRIGPGVPSGTLTEDSGLFTSATLVAGPTDMHLVENDPALSFAITADCGVDGGVAVCTVAASGNGVVSTTVQTETAVGFDVQVAATASIAGSGSSSSARGAPTPLPMPSSGTPTTGSATGSGATPPPSIGTSDGSAPSATGGNNNGVGRIGSSAFGIGLSVVFAVVMQNSL
ncbi:hypothetical protein BC628DRAFT_1313834 [Trametes gibbosa]|nr:hypothetical protein BC628DRAFT_1313834 [Trametes gibbosa]